MAKMLGWLRRVPVWIWLFIATTQILSFGTRLYGLPDLDASIVRMKSYNQPAAYESVIGKYEEIRASRVRDIVGAMIVGPISIALAFWKWRQHGPDTAAPADPGALPT